MGSVSRMIRDLTLPLLSVFSGHGFDHVVREAFDPGAARIEDLWTPFFCASAFAALPATAPGNAPVVPRAPHKEPFVGGLTRMLLCAAPLACR